MHLDDQQPRTAGAAAVRERGARIEVVRSSARRRSSSAGVRDGRVVVRVPAHLTARSEAATVEELLARLHARARAPAPVTPLPRHVAPRPTRTAPGPRGDPELVGRADAVAARYLAERDVHADRVSWSHRMSTRWASCTVPPGRIRVSHRLADAPDVVLDVLLLHELAHVLQPGHGPAFRRLADRHPQVAHVDAWLARRSHEELCAALGLP